MSYGADGPALFDKGARGRGRRQTVLKRQTCPSIDPQRTSYASICSSIRSEARSSSSALYGVAI
jgi:hypothetical protein